MRAALVTLAGRLFGTERLMIRKTSNGKYLMAGEPEIDPFRLTLEFDAEVTALRYVVEQLLVGLMLREPDQMQSIRELFESINARLDEAEKLMGDYKQGRPPLLRVEVERLLGVVTATVDRACLNRGGREGCAGF
jgi:hypothetical protein